MFRQLAPYIPSKTFFPFGESAEGDRGRAWGGVYCKKDLYVSFFQR